MIKTTIFAVMTAGFILAGISTAAAQSKDAPIFIDINAGAQTQSRAIQGSTSFPLYGETAVINSAQSIESGGLFDISGGYRFARSLGVAVGVSMFSQSGDGSIVASIPSPIAFNKAVTVTSTATDLKHSEVVTNLMLVYFVPIIEKFDANFFVGPSFFSVKQDILSATVAPGTQNTTVATQEEKANATGVNVGMNLNYLIRRNYGAGVFLRYVGGTVDLPSSPDVKVGGFQFGAGLRLRF
jgi:hypothetical protein